MLTRCLVLIKLFITLLTLVCYKFVEMRLFFLFFIHLATRRCGLRGRPASAEVNHLEQ